MKVTNDLGYNRTMDTNKARSIRIGSIYAFIGSDRRYCSRIEAFVQGDTCTVVLSEHGAAGGMDSDSGASPFREMSRRTCEAKPNLIIKAIKASFDSTIKRYGKPSKDFQWDSFGDHVYGLSAAKCAASLKWVKEVQSAGDLG